MITTRLTFEEILDLHDLASGAKRRAKNPETKAAATRRVTYFEAIIKNYTPEIAADDARYLHAYVGTATGLAPLVPLVSLKA